MKEQYIVRVLRALPRSRRAAVRRDLEEIFAEAQRRGETEMQVAERLGPPEVFARGAAPGKQGKGVLVGLVLCAAAAVGALGASALAAGLRSRFPADAIGGAEGMTDLRVEGFDALPLLALLGLAALVGACVCAARLYRARRAEKEAGE